VTLYGDIIVANLPNCTNVLDIDSSTFVLFMN